MDRGRRAGLTVAWNGKLVGGLIGGMMGGPVGAGIGATLGHVLGDTARGLEAAGLEWQHHAFSPSGPGVHLQPVWIARGRKGADVVVAVRLGDFSDRAVVTVDADPEECHVPRFFAPYAEVGQAERVEVRLKAAGAADRAGFDLAVPNAVRRLGGSGPARVVMALVACARAGGRALTRDDVRFVRESFTEGQPLDDAGVAWLRAWLKELRAADVERLVPEKVARRLDPHLDAEGRVRMVGWLVRGCRETWPGDAQEDWIATFAAALGVDAATVGAMFDADPRDDTDDAWAVLGVPAGTSVEDARAAWLRLVRQWHPDRAPSPADVDAYTRRTAEINAAWRRIAG